MVSLAVLMGVGIFAFSSLTINLFAQSWLGSVSHSLVILLISFLIGLIISFALVWDDIKNNEE